MTPANDRELAMLLTLSVEHLRGPANEDAPKLHYSTEVRRTTSGLLLMKLFSCVPGTQERHV